jgi:hypothetical protein
MNTKQKKVEPDPSEFASFGDYLARVVDAPENARRTQERATGRCRQHDVEQYGLSMGG